jgi:hypothetical protein
MALSNSIFVGRPDAIDLKADGETIVNLDEALAAAASDATEITILGGYYDRLWGSRHESDHIVRLVRT